MGVYFLKRLLLIVPSALLALLLVFFLYDYSYQDNIPEDSGRFVSGTRTSEQIESINCETRKSLHMDWPIFYFTVHPMSIPSNIRSICNEQKRKLLESLSLRSGNQEVTTALYSRLVTLHQSGNQNQITLVENILKSKNNKALQNGLSSLASTDKELHLSYLQYQKEQSVWYSFIPILTFNGTNNRFHTWISNAVVLNFGRSILDHQPVAKKINSALRNTLIFTLPAVFSIFTISIILAYLIQSRSMKFVPTILYFIDTIPLFWLSILLILLFSQIPGMGWNFTSAITYSSAGDSSIIEIVTQISRHGLPILALTLASIPYVTKQMESAFTHVRSKPYIETAIAKGLNRSEVFKRHIFKNSLIPILTIFFSFLAFAFGGAFVVEMVFSINGIGKLMADSVLANDFQTISIITLYLIVIKMIFTLLNDMVTYMIDPTIKF